MKLHTKMTLALLVGLLLVVTAAQVFQYLGVAGSIASLSDTQVKVLRTREDENARNICASVERAVASSLERGEMQKFSRLLEEQRQVKGLIEFSLYSREGVVSHSSEPGALKRKLPADLQRLLTSPDEVVQRTSDRILIYRPQHVNADCVRCHTSWKEGEVGGVNFFSFSTAALAEAEQHAQAAITNTKSGLFRNSLLTIAGIVAVLVAMVYFLIRKFVGRPLDLFVTLLRKFETSEGDLTHRIPIQTRDEIGGLARLFNNFISNLEQAIGKSKKTATVVGNSAQSQARAVEQTTASMKQLSAAVQQNAGFANKADTLISQANTSITEAHQSMQKLTGAMDQIASASNQIAKVTKVIDEIASKTNLLALNAAVEAARAGQAGAGFAVVAEDVRKLARQSADAAHNIADLIEGAVARIQEGKTLVDQTRVVFETAAGRSSQATELVQKIARLSAEQTQGVSAVTSTLNEVNTSATHSASQAEELMTEMNSFRTA